VLCSGLSLLELGPKEPGPQASVRALSAKVPSMILVPFAVRPGNPLVAPEPWDSVKWAF